MSLTKTPLSNRLHIGIFGKRNSGKSSLINAITNQKVALVSDIPGTTTDPVYKSMEIHGIGPCVFIDTAGFDDIGELGSARVEKTIKVIEKTDIALIVFSADSYNSITYSTGNTDEDSYIDEGNYNEACFNIEEETKWIDLLAKNKIPVIAVVNKIDVFASESIKNTECNKDSANLCKAIKGKTGLTPILVSAKENIGIEKIREEIIRILPEDYEVKSITGNLVNEDDIVLLVMPQDIQAPKGRLILPQVQTICDLLDKKCIVISVTTDKLDNALNSLSKPPSLIITDSQVFRTVYDKKPKESKLTSFSILFANYKGDLKFFAESAYAIEKLNENSKVLIAEACTHAPLEEDIGREKIPRMLRKKVGEKLRIDIVSGTDFPDDLSGYDLIIHCGGCMFNKKYVLSRVKKALAQGVPMSNYGVVIAYLSGILDKIDLDI
ncbi:MAG: [FeFe] hydrogenase H-cluster maturation GTPase HydF [Clostridiaceae bacterium]|nr:[FeFe] hydrogenase H-cluster maturation GTPase HydF [Clostridiaceae bacterium]